MLFLLLLVAVTAMSLNVKSGMQVKMAANQSADAQTYFDQLAVIEASLWKLGGDPTWRVPAGENYPYQGRTYIRTVANSAISSPTDYRDVVTISVRTLTAPTSGNKFLVNKSFRYNIDTPFLVRTPRQVCVDSAGSIFFADTSNHSIWKIDAFTGAILRVAGTGMSGFSGDGGPATEAQLNNPRGVWADGMGNLYIADTNNNRIRKVAAGFISTVAGNGTAGYAGDGGAATSTRINNPQGVSVDASGNIYIADTGNNRIRKVSAGIISTVVNTSGNQTSTPPDFTYPLGDAAAATAATLNGPRSVFVDAAGDIYIADTGNNRIRKVTTSTGIISTVAGISGNYSGPYLPLGDGGAATSAQLDSPRSVFVDSALNIYIADRNNNEIRKVTASDGKINTIVNTSRTAGYSGDGGVATAAHIDSPNGVCVKSTGEVIIADTNNSCLRQVSVTNTISTLPMTAGPGLNAPQGMATYYDAAQKKLFLYIADQGNNRIRQLDTATNAIVTVAGTGTAGYTGDGVAATSARINNPYGVSVDAVGNIYIADTGNNRIRKFTVGGNISTVAGNGLTGLPLGDGGAATSARINGPQGVSVDAAGNIYIADTNNNRIRKFTVGGNISTAAGTGTAGYTGDRGAATSARINSPQGVSVDASGNIYIADTGNNVLRLVNIDTGIISTMANIAGTGGYNGDNKPAVDAWLSSPGGVALGLQKGGGRIFIGDTGNDRVRVLFLKTKPQVYGP